MRAVVQRVTEASVRVDGELVGAIDHGLLALVSVGHDDTDADTRVMIDKLAGLRIFADERDRMNLSVVDAGGQVLLVSQFTLHGDVRKGKRPSFVRAMQPDVARKMVDDVAAGLRERGLTVAEGRFGADMKVALVNDGPVTILIDSKKVF